MYGSTYWYVSSMVMPWAAHERVQPYMRAMAEPGNKQMNNGQPIISSSALCIPFPIKMTKMNQLNFIKKGESKNLDKQNIKINNRPSITHKRGFPQRSHLAQILLWCHCVLKSTNPILTQILFGTVENFLNPWRVACGVAQLAWEFRVGFSYRASPCQDCIQCGANELNGLHTHWRIIGPMYGVWHNSKAHT